MVSKGQQSIAVAAAAPQWQSMQSGLHLKVCDHSGGSELGVQTGLPEGDRCNSVAFANIKSSSKNLSLYPNNRLRLHVHVL